MKVLIAVDGSEHSKAAAQFARDLPSPQPLEVTLLMVINPPDMALSSSAEMWYPQYVEHQQEYAEETLKQISDLFADSSVKSEAHITQGHIGNAVVDYAETMGAELVVVGAKGHSAIGRILLGSVSDYVATHAPVSVVVIRPRQGDATAHPRKVAIAYDGSKPSEVALDEFSKFDWSADEEVHVITASPKLEVFREDILSSVMEEGARRRSEALRVAKSGADRLAGHGWTVTPKMLEAEHIGEGILEAAGAVGSDLIVLGDARRGALTRLFLGSTSRYVLRHAEQSVWIARKPKE